MSYTALTDPFTINFQKDGIHYEAIVTYAQSKECCVNFFDVSIQKPKGMERFHLKEKPTLSPDFDYMVWVDEHEKMKMLYQLIGNEIEIHLRKNLGIFLIGAPVADQENNSFSGEGND